MPIVNITISPIDKAMKDKIIKNVTQVMHETTKIPREAFTIVIDEKDHDNIGIGGQSLTTIMK